VRCVTSAVLKSERIRGGAFSPICKTMLREEGKGSKRLEYPQGKRTARRELSRKRENRRTNREELWCKKALGENDRSGHRITTWCVAYVGPRGKERDWPAAS